MVSDFQTLTIDLKIHHINVIINHLLLRKNDLKEIFEILKKERYEKYSYGIQVI